MPGRCSRTSSAWAWASTSAVLAREPSRRASAAWVCKNLTLRGGIGFAVVGLLDKDDPDEQQRGSFGGDYSLGIAYDWFFSKNDLSGGWALTPVIEVRYLPDDPVSTVLGVVGLEILYFNGLPTNELELPAGEGYDKQ